MSFELQQFAIWSCVGEKRLLLVPGEQPDEALTCPRPEELITIAGNTEALRENPIPLRLLTSAELDEWVGRLRTSLCTVIRHPPTSVIASQPCLQKSQ
jgi:hypothetical protein